MRWIFVLFFVVQFSAFAEAFPFEQVKANILSYYLLDGASADARSTVVQDSADTISVKPVDQSMAELLQMRRINYRRAEKLVNSVQPDGSWPDINYQDSKPSGWEPARHLDRLFLLTRVYLEGDSPLRKSEALSEVLHRAMGFWFKKDLVCRNWWFNQIGGPKTMGPVFIMLEDELTEEERTAAVAMMSRAKFGLTGQNKVWLAGNVFFRAVLTRDEALARQARDVILSELVMRSGQEGVQADYSYHQHGPQQQFGNYGLAYINSMSYWGLMFSGTDLALNGQQVGLLRSLLLEGYDWIVWRGQFDLNGLGRQLFKKAQKGKALSVAKVMRSMCLIDPGHQLQYFAFIDRNWGAQSGNGLLGSRHYWRSDLTVHRNAGWQASIKMSSRRVIGVEAGNNENLKGYYLGDGATYIQRTGQEYAEIFPIWDWRAVPGVTCYQSDEPLPVLGWKGYRNGSDFSGGVSSGLLNVTSTHVDRDGLSARKSWFFIDNVLICLGAGICSSNHLEVATSVNQCHLKGDVIYSDGVVQQLVPGGSFTADAIRWVHHDGVGYRFLKQGTVALSSLLQEGDWHDIAGFYASVEEKGAVFKLSLHHGPVPQNGTYAYAVQPGCSVQDLDVPLAVHVVVNSSACQAVASQGALLVAVHQPSTLSVSPFGRVGFESPGLYVFEKSSDAWTVSCADPTQLLTGMSLVLNGESFKAVLPSGEMRGSKARLLAVKAPEDG